MDGDGWGWMGMDGDGWGWMGMDGARDVGGCSDVGLEDEVG